MKREKGYLKNKPPEIVSCCVELPDKVLITMKA